MDKKFSDYNTLNKKDLEKSLKDFNVWKNILIN